jgi:hypothetical protein
LFYGLGGICVAVVIFILLNYIFQTNYKIEQKKIRVGFIFCYTISGLFVDINIAIQELSLIPLNIVLEITLLKDIAVGRSQWQRGLRHEPFSPTRILGS